MSSSQAIIFALQLRTILIPRQKICIAVTTRERGFLLSMLYPCVLENAAPTTPTLAPSWLSPAHTLSLSSVPPALCSPSPPYAIYAHKPGMLVYRKDASYRTAVVRSFFSPSFLDNGTYVKVLYQTEHFIFRMEHGRQLIITK